MTTVSFKMCCYKVTQIRLQFDGFVSIVECKTVCLLFMCLGKYFPTPEVDVVSETNQDYDVIPQGTIIINY